MGAIDFEDALRMSSEFKSRDDKIKEAEIRCSLLANELEKERAMRKDAEKRCESLERECENLRCRLEESHFKQGTVVMVKTYFVLSKEKVSNFFKALTDVSYAALVCKFMLNTMPDDTPRTTYREISNMSEEIGSSAITFNGPIENKGTLFGDVR